ncbi:hypothetical protein [Actinacidiphila glaucinigra]|uniref:Uncharacterized protein n=1 Tax=Actinacidiphila glaucinigra TaxID=235986 RepID=A0A239KKQ9_9ACTN|nr:hypothetical protein [Actinacidiphila glaucinigra]SNT18956.1 hypothetical protein SAMN05216252_11631 [Actinacidiphila glaucinigra]
MPPDTQTHRSSTEESRPRSQGVRLPTAIVAVLVALVLGCVLAPRIRIDVHLAVPTLPALIAAELIRRLVRSFISPKDR